eukprot:384856_1
MSNFQSNYNYTKIGEEEEKYTENDLFPVELIVQDKSNMLLNNQYENNKKTRKLKSMQKTLRTLKLTLNCMRLDDKLFDGWYRNLNLSNSIPNDIKNLIFDFIGGERQAMQSANEIIQYVQNNGTDPLSYASPYIVHHYPCPACFLCFLLCYFCLMAISCGFCCDQCHHPCCENWCCCAECCDRNCRCVMV